MARPRRVDGCSYVGLNRYFLTFCVSDRRHAFVDGDVVQVVLAQFRKTAALEKFSLSAYCFMPDHVHLLVEATDQRSDLRRFAKLAKQRAGAAHALSGRSCHLANGISVYRLGGVDSRRVARGCDVVL